MARLTDRILVTPPLFLSEKVAERGIAQCDSFVCTKLLHAQDG